jgi:UDP-N-acetylglucosamine transferase subunit ALG13
LAQHPYWERRGWGYLESVFEDFRPPHVPQGEYPRSLRVVVLVGTLRFPFRRLLERVAGIASGRCEVFAQSGATVVDGLPLEAKPLMSPRELSALISGADVVVAHAGVGSALDALDAGKLPILVPREAAYGEHVDDHQLQIALELHARGLAIARSVDELTFDDLLTAAGIDTDVKARAAVAV